MGPRNRRLLEQYDLGVTIPRSPPSSPLFHTHEPEPEPEPIATVHNATSSAPSKIETPFDSSLALTILILLTALFVMGFFSMYIRRFADDSTAQMNSRQRNRRRSHRSPGGHLPSWSSAGKGLDPETVGSLPVCRYGGGAAAEECAICLSDFEDGESVKAIPYCSHLFHVDCIDTWLGRHGSSCPVCRATQLRAAGESGSTAESGDAWRGVGEVSVMRRISSCSSLGERAGLRRTSSF